jgi:formate dehydrogenase iron-sulfur subunit
MMSDVCKHCVNAPCLEVCPTGAIIRTEFDSVYIQEPVCNGCRDCVSACPFGVIHMSGLENEGKGTAKKCTLCYDRMQNGLTPACAQACPTASIQFGPIEELRVRAQQRLDQLHSQGLQQARLYGHDETVLGGLNAFYLLMDEPEVYGLPSNPQLPSRTVAPTNLWSLGSALLMGIAGLISFRKRRMDRFAGERKEDNHASH